ncbi:hypothetical protein M409DRAFT_63857 [Zasmidium cellare ATCC 36951]|uniref:DNA topoisomerase (ATP-hydrolyzing) n=1 Tax=Zasmidium cellare ATCC 36951 TaxID=1080233 RepID=A0A6A6CU57_ZASCE|nr:uncharacterized protein M409DRAFT_63857 [Zasmidium cellare ATCC 36951]KAF2170797.1 hypothetical protein M409DRAFT_63857 [Zasmidium cellare ATCC 36951]
MDFDDDDFQDLFDEAQLLPDSSQESLNDQTANITFAEVADEDFDIPNLQRCRDANERKENDSDEMIEAGDSAPAEQEAYDQDSNVTAKIEACFERIVDALLNEKDEISITLKSRKTNRSARDGEATSSERLICFPGKSAEEAWRFSVVLRILELMHEATRTNTVLSKRDIFYRDPALFGKQSHVDRYVDDIALTFGVTRSSLNVTAAAKGLIAGAVNICHKDGSIVDARADREGMLITNVNEILSVDMSDVKFILVIEKEATFRSIAASDFWDVIRSQGVVMTGKGYPDLSSRAMLRLLSTASPQNGFASPPVYGLADFDPDGMAILSTYKYGSRALMHESEEHCVPQLQRIGLRSAHLLVGDDTQGAQGILALTARDRKKGTKLLSDNPNEMLDRSELQTMLMFNMKAELQLLDSVPGAVDGLLTAELKYP